MTVASWERNPCHGNNICVDKLMSKLDDYGGCHSGTDHTGHFRHHPLASLVVIVWKLVGQRLFLNIIPNNFLARTRRIVWCELIDPPPLCHLQTTWETNHCLWDVHLLLPLNSPISKPLLTATWVTDSLFKIEIYIWPLFEYNLANFIYLVFTPTDVPYMFVKRVWLDPSQFTTEYH